MTPQLFLGDRVSLTRLPGNGLPSILTLPILLRAERASTTTLIQTQFLKGYRQCNVQFRPDPAFGLRRASQGEV